MRRSAASAPAFGPGCPAPAAGFSPVATIKGSRPGQREKASPRAKRAKAGSGSVRIKQRSDELKAQRGARPGEATEEGISRESRAGGRAALPVPCPCRAPRRPGARQGCRRVGLAAFDWDLFPCHAAALPVPITWAAHACLEQ